MNILLRAMAGLLLIFSFATMVHAETFEFLTFTPPPGWNKQMTADGIVFRRANGIGLISFYASRPPTGTPNDEFARTWKERIETPLSIKAPQPKIETDGEYKLAIGAQNVDAQGTMTAISLVTIVGAGRSISISTIVAGDDATREVAAFFDSISINKAASPVSAPGGVVDIDFDVPPGYVSQRDGGVIILKPMNMNRTTPCVYGISPSRRSKGSLDADARAALLEPLPGWQIKSEHHNAMRGVSGGGWQYYWLRTDVQQMSGGSMQYLTAMATAFPTGPGQVGIVWGFGSAGTCSVDDVSFLRLFFSLRPRGIAADGGKALTRELHGLWRDTQGVGMAQYKFLADGRYEYGMGTSTTFGNLETRTGKVTDGRWSLRGSELTLTGGSRGGSRFRVRVYDEFLGGVWRRGMSLLNDAATPPLEVHYMRID
jgi:hypothetical protein